MMQNPVVAQSMTNGETIITLDAETQKQIGLQVAALTATNLSRELKSYCALDEPTMELLKFAMADLNLSARAYDRILKVARTIADLAGVETIAGEHVSEAIQLRSLDRQLWG